MQEERIRQAVKDGKPSAVFRELTDERSYGGVEIFPRLLEAIDVAGAKGVPALAEELFRQMLQSSAAVMYRSELHLQQRFKGWDNRFETRDNPLDEHIVNEPLAQLTKTHNHILNILKAYAALKRQKVVGLSNDELAAEIEARIGALGESGQD